MTRIRTIINDNLRTPDSYTVECGGFKKNFSASEKKEIGSWVKSIWNEEMFPSTAYVYFNIDWDCDHILHCKYDLIND